MKQIFTTCLLMFYNTVFANPVIHPIALQAYNGNFVSVYNDSTRANSLEINRAQQLEIIDFNGGQLMGGDTVALKSMQGWYLTCDFDGNEFAGDIPDPKLSKYQLLTIYSVVGNGKFDGVVPIKSGMPVTFKTKNYYSFTAPGGGNNDRMRCNQQHSRTYETFRIIGRYDSQEHLKISVKNSMFTVPAEIVTILGGIVGIASGSIFIYQSLKDSFVTKSAREVSIESQGICATTNPGKDAPTPSSDGPIVDYTPDPDIGRTAIRGSL